MPHFPAFKPLELADRDVLAPRFRSFRPETSEWTFTNFFIWRGYYRFEWTEHKGLLVFLAHPTDGEPYLLMPVGDPALPRIETAALLLGWLAEEKRPAQASVHKADRRFAEEAGKHGGYRIEPQRNHFDYVYAGEDLVTLAGRRFHSKKNHLNRFMRSHPDHRYEPFAPELAPECLRVLDNWRRTRDFGHNPVLEAEYAAVVEALNAFGDLGLRGGVMFLDGRVEAFTVGSLLNPETAVVHIEKADPAVPGLFTAINQRFVLDTWPSVPWINREQDLGEEGLRRAKLSYNPTRMVEKFRITPV